MSLDDQTRRPPMPESKSELRREAQARRAALHAEVGEQAAHSIASQALPFIDDDNPSVVSGFYPIRSEVDLRPLLQALSERGHDTALPVVAGRDEPLIFRRWRPGEPVDQGWQGIGEPPSTAPSVVPDVLLVPLLLVDAQGYRLGYGAGHYDRTIAVLRRSKRVVAAGVGFEGQKVSMLPREAHDIPLDWLVTERGVTRFPHGASA